MKSIAALCKALCIEITIKADSKLTTTTFADAPWRVPGIHPCMYVYQGEPGSPGWQSGIFYMPENASHTAINIRSAPILTHTYVSMQEYVTYFSSRATHTYTYTYARWTTNACSIFLWHMNVIMPCGISLPDYVFTSHRERKRVCNVTIIYSYVV